MKRWAKFISQRSVVIRQTVISASRAPPLQLTACSHSSFVNFGCACLLWLSLTLDLRLPCSLLRLRGILDAVLRFRRHYHGGMDWSWFERLRLLRRPSIIFVVDAFRELRFEDRLPYLLTYCVFKQAFGWCRRRDQAPCECVSVLHRVLGSPGDLRAPNHPSDKVSRRCKAILSCGGQNHRQLARREANHCQVIASLRRDWPKIVSAAATAERLNTHGIAELPQDSLRS